MAKNILNATTVFFPRKIHFKGSWSVPNWNGVVNDCMSEGENKCGIKNGIFNDFQLENRVAC